MSDETPTNVLPFVRPTKLRDRLNLEAVTGLPFDEIVTVVGREESADSYVAVLVPGTNTGLVLDSSQARSLAIWLIERAHDIDEGRR